MYSFVSAVLSALYSLLAVRRYPSLYNSGKDVPEEEDVLLVGEEDPHAYVELAFVYQQRPLDILLDYERVVPHHWSRLLPQQQVTDVIELIRVKIRK